MLDALRSTWQSNPNLVVALAALIVAATAGFGTLAIDWARARRDARKRKDKKTETPAFLAGFAQLRLDNGDPRAFVWKYPPGWNAPEGSPVRLSDEECFWIAVAVWKLPDCKPAWTSPDVLNSRLVYATGPRRSYRSPVLDTAGTHALALLDRRGEREPDKCFPCRRHVSSNGERCSNCDRPVEVLRKEAKEFERTGIVPPRFNK